MRIFSWSISALDRVASADRHKKPKWERERVHMVQRVDSHDKLALFTKQQNEMRRAQGKAVNEL